MTTKYKIVKVDEEKGSVEVNFYDDVSDPVGLTYAIDLPLINGAYPTGTDLEACILQYAPTAELMRKSQAKQADATSLIGLIGLEQSFTPVSVTPQAQAPDASLALVQRMINIKTSLLAELTMQEREDYIAAYMANLDTFHASDPKWTKLGALEKARAINALMPAETEAERSVKLNNVSQMLDVISVL